MSARATKRNRCVSKDSLEANHCSEATEYGTISKYLYQKTKQTNQKQQVKRHCASTVMESPQEDKLVLDLLTNFSQLRVKRRPRELHITK